MRKSKHDIDLNYENHLVTEKTSIKAMKTFSDFVAIWKQTLNPPEIPSKQANISDVGNECKYVWSIRSTR